MFRWTGRRIFLAVACTAAVALPLLTIPAWAGDTPSPAPLVAAGDASYWTAQRMQQAAPLLNHRPTAATVQPAVSGPGRFLAGIPEVGTFFVDTPTGDTTCSGSVVHSPGKNLVLTAGHCLYSWKSGTAHRIFVPQYAGGLDAAHQPYGFFPVDTVFVDPRFTPAATTSSISDLDFGFARIAPNAAGTLIEDATGGLYLKTTPGYRNTVTAMGYPSKSHNPKGQVWTCATTTAPLAGYHQMQMTCPGFFGGVSGGPWIVNYNATLHTGDVIGETGGLFAGGDTDWVSYSPMLGQDAQQLFADATAGALSPRTEYASVPAPGALPGTPAAWKGARLLASGDFAGHGRSDLLTVWSDGRVTVFPSDGTGGYTAQKVLVAANSRWKTARLITAGDFDGGSRFDLMVVWSNGVLSSFVDTTTTKLGAEKKFAGVGMSTAAQITAGRFGTSSYVTDLVVLSKDGSLNLYSSAGSGKLGTKHPLAKASSVWRNATLFSSGQYNHGSTWDLLVRWVDGELDNYPGVNPKGMGAEHRLRNPNTTWRSAAVITTGRYTSNAYADDVLIRWADGHTSIYPDTTLARLGPEQPLVKP